MTTPATTDQATTTEARRTRGIRLASAALLSTAAPLASTWWGPSAHAASGARGLHAADTVLRDGLLNGEGR